MPEYKIGTIRGNAIHEAITKGLNPIVTDNEETQFKMLAAERFEVAIIARAVVPGLAKAAGIGDYTVHEPAVHVTPLYFGLSSKNAAIGPKLRAAFRKAVDSGQWNKDLVAIMATMNK